MSMTGPEVYHAVMANLDLKYDDIFLCQVTNDDGTRTLSLGKIIRAVQDALADNDLVELIPNKGKA